MSAGAWTFRNAIDEISIDSDRKRVALESAMESLERNGSRDVKSAIALAVCDAVAALADYDN